MNYILYAYFGEKSSIKLAKMTDSKAHNSLNSLLKCKPDDVVIRWGSVHSLSGEPYVINKRASIEESSSKGHARHAMRLGGVNVPEPWDGKSKTLPVIARPEIHHAGNEFYVCKTVAEAKAAKARGCTYFSRVFKKKAEYRVHCARGKVLFIQQKPLDGIKASDEGWTILLWDDYIKPVCVQALKAIEMFGLDFAAVDVMWNGREAVVCEINCAPAIESPFQRSKYANLFKWFITNAGSSASWNWSEFKTGRDFAWRLNQLRNPIPKLKAKYT